MKNERNWQPWEFYKDCIDIPYFFAYHERSPNTVFIFHRIEILRKDPEYPIWGYLFSPVDMLDPPQPKVEYEYWLYWKDELYSIVFDENDAEHWIGKYIERSIVKKPRTLR